MIADAEVAKAAADRSPDVLMAQALIRKATGNWQEAIRFFGEVLKNDPGNVEPYRLPADIWDSAGQLKKAEEIYRHQVVIERGCFRVHGLPPAIPIHWGNLGDALWQLPGEKQHARTAFERAAELAISRRAEIPELLGGLGATTYYVY